MGARSEGAHLSCFQGQVLGEKAPGQSRCRGLLEGENGNPEDHRLPSACGLRPSGEHPQSRLPNDLLTVWFQKMAEVHVVAGLITKAHRGRFDRWNRVLYSTLSVCKNNKGGLSSDERHRFPAEGASSA